MPATIDRTSEKLAAVIRALGKVSGDVQAAGQLLALLGWRLPPGIQDIGLAQFDVALVAAKIDALTELRSHEDASEAELAAAVAEVVLALTNALGALQQLGASFGATPEYLSVTHIRDEFFPRLADLLVIQLAGSIAPPVVPVGMLLGVFELNLMPADPSIFQVEHVRQVVRWDRFGPLFTDPANIMRDVYGWGTPQFQGNKLIANLGRLAEHFADCVTVRPLPREVEERITGRSAPEAVTNPAAQLLVSLAKGLGFDAQDVGLALYPLRPTTGGGSDGGLGISPYAVGTAAGSFPLSDTVSLVFSASADLEGGLALILRAGGKPQILSRLLEPPPSGTNSPSSTGSFALSLRSAAPAGERHELFSAPGLHFDAAAISATLRVDANVEPNPTLVAGIEDGRFLLVADQSDGFLASILPKDGVTASMNLGISYSHRDGLRFEGGAGLNTTLSLNRQLGPLRLLALDLGVAASSSALSASAGLTASVALGPVTATVQSVGAAVALRFTRGNLGPVDLGAQFKPPSGIGLAIDAAAVTGGGFLLFDPPRGLYTGAVQLNLEGGLSVSALGMIATRMPGGAKGFSLLVVITAQGFQPVPLGLGFKLTGIGGLLAINRTFDEEVLRDGVKNRALDSVLFPPNPARDALQLLSGLNRVFPISPGHHLLGPMVEIQWGTPALITMQLGIVLEIGARLRLLVMGQVEAVLPRKENDLLRIKMDAVGIIDFDQGTASLDAVLYESRLLKKFVLTGGMAMRLRWKSGPSFALAIGGLHHAFNPPANFPTLDRIAINLSAGNNPRLTCEAYFAVTSNTVQFGARASLYAAAHGFSIEGGIGFDVLIQLSPFHFLAEFQASIQLKRGSRNLFKVKVEGALEGPRPLRARGKATFEILWWDVSISFDKTLVEGAPPPPPPGIDVLGELAAALGDRRNWQEALPPGARRVAATRELPAAGEVRIHPLAKLGVKQTVVPLNLTRDIDKFGSSPPIGARRFRITTVAVAGVAQTLTPLSDFFAPGQFFELTDDESVASPSFDTMEAGVMAGTDAFVFDNSERINTTLEYETILVDRDAPQPAPPKPGFKLNQDQLFLHAKFGAAARSAVLRTGTARFQNRERAPEIAVTASRYAIASTEDLSPQAAPGVEAGRTMTWIDARETMRKLKQLKPDEAARRQVVRAYELVR